MDTSKLRIVYLGARHDPANSEQEISRALRRLGHEVIELNEHGTSGQTLIDACERHQPDLLLGAKFRVTGADGFDGPSARKVVDVIGECRPHVGQICCWVFDALMPEFVRERWRWAETLAPAVDVFAATDGSATAQLPNGFWLPQGSSDLVDDNAPWPAEFAGDVLFLGTAYRQRNDFVQRLSDRFGGRFRHYPAPNSGEKERRGRDLTALVRSYRMCVCPPYPTWRRYWSNRLVNLARHGALMASPVIEGMAEDGWAAGENYLSLPTNQAEIAAALDGHLSREPAALEAIRRAGCEHATRLTYDARCQRLLAALAKACSLSRGRECGAEVIELAGDMSGNRVAEFFEGREVKLVACEVPVY